VANIGKPPCHEGVIRSAKATAPCTRSAAPWILAATILGSSMAFIDGTVVNVALPEIQQRLNATAVDAQWIVESYALFLAALILVGGSLGDHYGRRRIFSLGIVLFTAASVWCGLAGGPEELILARAMQGVGGAMLVPGFLAIISASVALSMRFQEAADQGLVPLLRRHSTFLSSCSLPTRVSLPARSTHHERDVAQ
jgi:MFS family permease